MDQVAWSPSAWRDLQRIVEFIAEDAPERASLLAMHFLDAVEHLAHFPRAGRIIPEIGSASAREIFIGPYRVMYQIDPDGVIITGIVHGARDWHPGAS